MKKLAMALMSLLTLVFCASCSSEIEGLESGSTTVQKQENKIRTKLNLTGEMLDVSSAPWTRGDDSEAKDWYMIQVWQRDSTFVTKTEADGSTSTEITSHTITPYAYGLFDDVSNLELDLVEGKTYKIEAVMIKDAADSVKYIELEKGAGTTRATFTQLEKPTNSFVLTSEESIDLEELNCFLYTKGNYNGSYLPLEEFYGVTEYYTPKEGNSASINLKRASFCMRLEAKDFTEGTITVKRLPCSPVIMTPETPIVQKVFSEPLMTDVSFGVEITWTKPDGTEVKLGEALIRFSRNTITTIRFSAKEASSSSTTTTQKSVTLNVENEEWQEGSIYDIN